MLHHLRQKQRLLGYPSILQRILSVRQKSGIKVMNITPRAASGPTIAIRREDGSIWERRSPLAPFHVRKLVRKGARVLVQPSNRRAYPLQTYFNANAVIQEDISDAPVIIGVKQPPVDKILPNKTYCFFSHTIKAQEDNMPLLDACLEQRKAHRLRGNCRC